jgi:hypothetical protein
MCSCGRALSHGSCPRHDAAGLRGHRALADGQAQGQHGNSMPTSCLARLLRRTCCSCLLHTVARGDCSPCGPATLWAVAVHTPWARLRGCAVGRWHGEQRQHVAGCHFEGPRCCSCVASRCALLLLCYLRHEQG